LGALGRVGPGECLTLGVKESPSCRRAGMMCALKRGRIDGKEKTADIAVVKAGCDEFAGACQNEAVAVAGGEEAGAYDWRGFAESHEARDQVSVD
jgi:hypothetical protein